MNLEQMKSFVSLAKCKSFSQAAKERYVSQPAISNHLKQLEEEMQCQLVGRKAKSIYLTEQGEIFFAYAMKILLLEMDMREQISEPETRVRRIFDIIAPHLQTDRLLSDFMVEGISKCPDVEYRIVEREDSEISNRVLSGEVELGITSIQVKNSQLVYEPCFIEEIVLITPNTEYYREMSLEKLKRILVNDGYVRFDFGGGSDYLWNDFFGKILGCDLHEIRTVARCSNYNITLKTVEQGMGIAFISNTVIREEVLSEKILAYRFSSLLQKQFYLVYNKERIALTSGAGYRSKELLMQEIQKHFDSMNEKIIDKYDREFQPFSKLVGL